ncbi:MAG: divergent polysaccharide deacetylase family protein [Thermodesulfobacteriota bacterium]
MAPPSSVKRTSSPSKRSAARRRNPVAANGGWKRFWVWFAVFLTMILVIGLAVAKWFPPKPVDLPLAAPPPAASRPLFEIYPQEPHPAHPETPLPSIPPTGLPKAAILFDDMGGDLRIAGRLVELGIPLTFSLLPFSPHRTEIAELASANGIEIMAHIPMEPKEYPHIQPGQGALMSGMSEGRLAAQLLSDLESLPQVVGMNNHMGSRLTAETRAMEQIMAIVKSKHLFYVDSRTIPSSAARSAARLLRVPYAERDVFLDHVVEMGAIRSQIVRFIETARRNGHALAIGHPHEETIAVLEEQLPAIRQAVTLVPVSAVVRVPPR